MKCCKKNRQSRYKFQIVSNIGLFQGCIKITLCHLILSHCLSHHLCSGFSRNQSTFDEIKSFTATPKCHQQSGDKMVDITKSWVSSIFTLYNYTCLTLQEAIPSNNPTNIDNMGIVQNCIIYYAKFQSVCQFWLYCNVQV